MTQSTRSHSGTRGAAPSEACRRHFLSVAGFVRELEGPDDRGRFAPQAPAERFTFHLAGEPFEMRLRLAPGDEQAAGEIRFEHLVQSAQPPRRETAARFALDGDGNILGPNGEVLKAGSREDVSVLLARMLSGWFASAGEGTAVATAGH